ncbi:MAG: cell division protein FtsL [Granulosicoccaceae bacterium]
MKTLVIVAALAAANFCTAVAVVYSKHLSRRATTDISRNQYQIDELDVQWSQLQIEEGTFSEHGLVERTARDRLGMVLPGLDDSKILVRHVENAN